MFVILLLAVVAVTQDYDALIDSLAGDKTTAASAHKSLVEAGTKAFPALLKRLDDETIIGNGLFQEEAMERTSDGKFILARPRIGRVAFLIIQDQIESSWPKGFRGHYALNWKNVADWLKKHDGQSITQMRIRAFADSIDSLSREIETEGVDEFRLKNLEFLHKRLGKILEDAKKVQ